MVFITLSSKPGLTFSKEHQTGACLLDALSRAKVALSLSVAYAILIYLDSYFQCLELVISVS